MRSQAKTKRLLIALSLLAALVLLPAATAPAATISADQEDYAPWEVVTLTGSGFAANSTVDILITWPDGYPDLIEGIPADAYGAFVYEYEKEKFGGTYTVEATDGTNTATTTFTDAAFNYSPQSVSLAADPGGTSVSFLQTVTGPSKNGSFTASLQVTGTGGNLMPASWVSASPTSLSFVTGTTNDDKKDDPESWTIWFSVPSGTAGGTYTAKIQAVASNTTVNSGNGTAVSLSVSGPVTPPGPIDTTLSTPTLSTTSLTLPGSVTVNGTLTVGTGGTLGNHTILLRASSGGGMYSDTGLTTLTNSVGAYSFTYTPAGAGSYTFQTKLLPSDSGNDGYKEATSASSSTLTVTSPPVSHPPTISNINPSSATQGDTLDVIITGTNFTTDATVAFSGNGITINSTTVDSATQITVNITIAPYADADVGPRTVTVTTPDGSADGTFTVNLAPDTTAPTVKITSGPLTWSKSTSASFEWEGSDDRTPPLDLLYSVSLDGGAWSDYSGATSLTCSGLTDGQHTFQVRAADGAGNIGYSDPWNFGTDTEAPVTTESFNGKPGNNGWYTSGGDVALDATDAGSGVAAIHYILNGGAEVAVPDDSATIQLTPEGVYTLEYWAVDNVGNEELPHKTAEIKIDWTPPEITSGAVTGTHGNGDWWRSPVTVAFGATDKLSGFAPDGALLTNMASKTTSGEGFALSVTSDDISDMAGNVAAGIPVGPFQVDYTAPVITAGEPSGTAGNNGWWRSDVTVPFSASDKLSGFDPDGALSIDMASKTTSGQGSGVYVTSDDISDMAGNVASGIQGGPFKIDWTPPTVTISLPASITVLLKEQNVSVDATWSATDNVSGVIPPTTGTITQSLITDTVGKKTIGITAPLGTAVDYAGNKSEAVTETYTYYVNYKFGGLQQPYEAPPRAFKLGSSIPLKWQYTDAAGNVVPSPDANPSVNIAFVSPQSSSETAIAVTDPGYSGLRYEADTWTWHYNWQTKGLTNGAGTYRIRISCAQTGQVDGYFPILLKK